MREQSFSINRSDHSAHLSTSLCIAWVHPNLEIACRLTQDLLLMLRKREGEWRDAWLTQVQESNLPEPSSCAPGVEQDQAPVQAG